MTVRPFLHHARTSSTMIRDLQALPGRVLRKCLSSAARIRAARRVGWPSGRRVASITFDDAPRSAATAGAQVLAEMQYAATYYVCLGLLGKGAADDPVLDQGRLETLVAQGHEIGCHTYSHLDLARTGSEELLADLERNRERAHRLGLPALESFAYPYGSLTPRAQALVAPHFRTARSTWIGLNAPRFDALALRAVPLMRREGLHVALREIERWQRDGGWLVLYTHEVTERPGQFGCTPDELALVCRRLSDSGGEVQTVGQVARGLAVT